MLVFTPHLLSVMYTSLLNLLFIWCYRERCWFLIIMNPNMIWTQEEKKASGLKRTVQILIAECQACGTHDRSIVLVYYKSPQAAIFSVTVTDLEILCLFFLNEHLCCLMFHVSHVNWVMVESCTNGLQCLPCCKTVSCRIKTPNH